MSIIRIKNKYEVADVASEHAAHLQNLFNIIPQRAEKGDEAVIYIDGEDKIAAYAMLNAITLVEQVPSSDPLRSDLALTISAAAPILFQRIRNEQKNGFGHGHHVGQAIKVSHRSGRNAAIHPDQNPYKDVAITDYAVNTGASSTLRLRPDFGGRYYVHVGLLLNEETHGAGFVMHQHMIEGPQNPTWFNVVSGEVFYLGLLGFGGDIGLKTKWMEPGRTGIYEDARPKFEGANSFFEQLFGALGKAGVTA